MLQLHQLLRIFALLTMIFASSLGAKKSDHRRFIVEVDDIKAFKKLQRTHTNLLVLFSKTEKDASKHLGLLGDVAKEIIGKGTIVYINCGDNKKLCKKLKVTPKPISLLHYKDGTFNKEYDRKNTFKSMMSFMNNPTGDRPWEEEPGAEDVVHIENELQLNKVFKKEKKPVLIMFYAPWCGFCKRFKPEFASAATELKDDSVLAGMDVDTQEGYTTRMKYNITGFPTIIYFEKGDEKFRYSGKYEKEALIEWMKNPSAPPPKEEEEEEWSDVPSDVVHLKDDTFDGFMEKNPSVLVMFYAPWCGHCKKMKPEYVEAAKTLKDEGIEGVLAAVDATKEVALGKKFKIEGYPSVKYFKDGKLEFDVNERKADRIVSFMKDPNEPPPPPPPEPEWSDVAKDVQHLTDENFKGFLKKKKHVFVMFYAPWCGHCKKAKPEVVTAAEHHKSNNKIAFAGVDCTKYPSVCEQYDIQGYPTFRYFNYGKKDFKYIGGRTSEDFIKFMEDPREGPPPPPPEPQWSDEPSNVQHLTDDDFDEFIKEHDSVLVMFYAPWCGHCKSMKPAYAEAADEMQAKKMKGVLAAVDCTKHRQVAKRFEISGFPTIKYFSGGKFTSDYGRARTKDELVDFMDNPEDKPKMPKEEKKPKEGSWAAENQDVVHLNDQTFEEFIKTHSSALVMFYAPWCPHCQKLKPAFGEIAKEINIEKKIEGAIAAVDCTETKTLCSEREIKGYPTLQYFKNGEFQFKYTGKRSAEGFREFMKNPKKPKPPPPAADWSKEDSKVVFLTDESFNSYIANSSDVLVMFYAPWCGHCNAMKKDYYAAAKALDNENPDAKLAAVDCTKNRKVVGQVKITGYPTVKLFKKGKEFKEYEGDRSMLDLVQFMRDNAGSDEKTALEKPSLIKTLTKETFKQFIKETEHVLVMFHAPWCGHCKQAKPEFEKAADVFKTQPQRVFASVDCTKYGSLCNDEDVNGYPTLRSYYYGTFVVEYDGDRVSEDFILFMEDPPIPYVPKGQVTPVAEKIEEKPAEPEKPAKIEEPGKPDEPVKPDEPEHPEEPVHPEDPAKTEEPVKPDEPGQPEEPVHPEEPAKTEEPVKPDEPGQPEEPVHPEDPAKTEEPVKPDEPGQPEEPVHPEEPAKTEEPVKPDEPGQLEEPTQPEIPEEPSLQEPVHKKKEEL